MTLVPTDRPLPIPAGYEPQAGDTMGPPAPEPRAPEGWVGDAAVGAIRQNNIFGSMLSQYYMPNPERVEEGYDTWGDIKGTKYEPYASRFLNVFNRKSADILKSQIDMEEHDREATRRAGFLGDVFDFAASMGDPTILLPGGSVIKIGRGGATVARGVLDAAGHVAAAAATQAAIQEAILQSTQQTRPIGQSAFAIGGSAILGGAIGASVSKLMGRETFGKLAREIEEQLAKRGPLPGDVSHDAVTAALAEGRSLSAAAVPRDTLDDLTVAGRAAGVVQRLSEALQLNPIVRAMGSPSVTVRSLFENMVENAVYLKKNLEGRTAGPSVERLIKVSEAGVAESMGETKAIWEAIRKEGERVSYYDFKQMVGRAMRRADESMGDPMGAIATGVIQSKVDEAVSRAARTWREKVFDPFKKRAIELGLLPEDVKVDTAASYFTRLYNKNKIDSRPGEFRKIVQDWVQQQTDKAVEGMTKSKDQRVARIGRMVSDLQLEGDARLAALKDIEEKIAALQQANPEHVQRNIDIARLGRMARKAADEGNAAQAALHEANQKIARDGGGTAFQDYLSNLRTLRQRLNLIRENIVGKGEAVERAKLKQADVEARNVEHLYRMKASVDRLEAQIDKLEPETLAARIADLKDDLVEVVQRTAGAEERIAKLEERAKAEPAGDAAKKAERAFIAEGKRQAEIERLLAQIEDLSAIDPEAAIAELRGLIDKRIAESARLVERGGKRIAELAAVVKKGPEEVKAVKDRVASLEARRAKIEEDWHQRTQVEMGEGYVEDIADNIIAQVTGRAAEAVPYNIVATTRGPLKERTFNIPDELIEPFLESDVELVGRRYARIMAADTELAARFGSPDLKDQIKSVHEDYRRIANAIDGKTDVPADRKEKMLRDLAKREQADVRDIEAMRDVLRGQYKTIENASGWGRILHAVNAFNYMRAMGGVVLASITDAARPMMVHGLAPFMQDGIKPLLTNLKAVRMSAQEARLANVATERLTLSRIADLAELADPYSRGHPVERWLDNASHIFSRFNGLALWTDWMKEISATMTQNRILRNVVADKLPTAERSYLAYLGINDDMARRIGGEFKKYGSDMQGVLIANTEKWDDVQARRAYRAAMGKDVDSIIVTPTAGDKPLFAYTPTGKALLQFKSFMLASHQKVLMRGLQENPYSFVNGLVTMSAMGMLITWLKAAETNRLDQLSDNPGFWIAEGLDRAGVFGLLFEVNNTYEKWGGPGIKRGMTAAFGGNQKGPLSRYASRSDIAAVLGPTADLGDTFLRVVRGMGDGDMTEGDVNAIRRLLPFATLPGIRTALEYGVMPSAREAVR